MRSEIFRSKMPSIYILVKAPPQVQYGKNITRAWVGKRLIHKAECCIWLKTTPECYFFHTAKMWRYFNWYKMLFVQSIHFVDSNCVTFQPSDNCLCTSLVIKQTNSIILATSRSGDLKCYTHDQQCCIFHTPVFPFAVLHGNHSTLIRLIYAHAIISNLTL